MSRPVTSPALLIEGFLAQTREYAVVCLDPEGIVVAWLGAAEELFGYSEAEIIGRPAATLFTAADRAKGFDKHELAAAAIDTRAEDDRWHVRKDGSQIWVSGTVQAVHDSRQQVVGFVKLMRDRTDLRTHINNVENELAENAASVQRTHRFIGKLGHEIRNPLAPMQSAVTILQKTCDDARARKAVQVLQNQIDAMRRIADDLMETTRLHSGKVDLQWEVCDARDLVRDACVGFSPVAAQRGIDLQSIVPAGPLAVRVDRVRFQQALSNLISNAIKYTAPGGHIWMKPTQEGRQVLIRIEDTGMGIGPETLPRIFDLFSRGKSAQETAPAGLGIGLSVVREIVELHDGTVQARSPGPGKGSEFSIRLPAADPQE